MKYARALVAGALLALLTAPALGQSYQGPNYLTFDVGRNLLARDPLRDRDLHVMTNSGINGQSIAAGVTLKSATPIALPDYNALYAHVTWTMPAAVDSDSVNVEVYFIGKLSTNTADGIDLPFDSYLTSGASFTVSGAGIDGWYITRNTNLYTPASPIMLLAKRVAGSGAQHQSGALTTWGVDIPIANNYGQWLAAPYVMCAVQNRSPTKAINVTVDYWPKVR